MNNIDYSDIGNHFNDNNPSNSFIPNFKALDILPSHTVYL